MVLLTQILGYAAGRVRISLNIPINPSKNLHLPSLINDIPMIFIYNFIYSTISSGFSSQLLGYVLFFTSTGLKSLLES